MNARTRFSATCPCGRVALEAVGAPILSAVCYCDSCRAAAREFEAAPGAPRVLGPDGGVAYCLFRKDRVSLVRGAEHLRDHRLTEGSPTRRVVAACCQAPMFLDFTRGHWLTLYRDRISDGAPPPEMGVMASQRPPGPARPDGLPTYPTHPARFMVRLLSSWAAMGFRRPKPGW